MKDLNSIRYPDDIKGMSIDELTVLSEELRAVLLKKLSVCGGHAGPNLGVVEATVALHYVFDAPTDKIVFDVSHQSYIHKMLTGRINAFTDPAHYNDVTGYTCPRESEYDLFEVGHTSTSIAMSIGLAEARNLKKGNENVVAFIGDASLGGGEALEGLAYAPSLKSNLIVILNDNQKSIADNHGALYDHLEILRQSNGQAANNIFKALGYQYIYVGEGNDMKSLVNAFSAAKDADHAVLVHINTMKGEGLPAAEADKERFHYTAPFDLKTGAPRVYDESVDYTDIFADHMLTKIRDNKNVAVLTAGTPGAIGFSPERRDEAGRDFIDTGICEQSAVSIVAGLAKGGCRPVMGVMATFIQRSYDQLSQDLSINDLPGVIVDFAGSVWGISDVTHLGFFDIAMASNIPNLIFLAPANAEEYVAMIDWAIEQTDHPVFIRTPGGPVEHYDGHVNDNFLEYDIVEKGKDGVAIIAAGSFLRLAKEASDILRANGVEMTIINPRILSSLDKNCLDSLRDYRQIITIEDGIVDGGFGQKVAAYMGAYGVRVDVLGLKKEFLDRYDAEKVLVDNGLTPTQIAEIAMDK